LQQGKRRENGSSYVVDPLQVLALSISLSLTFLAYIGSILVLVVRKGGRNCGREEEWEIEEGWRGEGKGKVRLGSKRGN